MKWNKYELFVFKLIISWYYLGLILLSLAVMQLGEIQKTHLLQSAQQVFRCYLSMDFFATRPFLFEEGRKTLVEICQRAVQSQVLKQTLTYEGQQFELQLTPITAPIQRYQIFFTSQNHSAVIVQKTPHDYQDIEALTLLSRQHFYIDVDEDGHIYVANLINESMVGGIGKINLYRSHLVTLNNIIEKITAETEISNLLVALATGSGKTYVQALWILVLQLSDHHGVFAVPDRLISQLMHDFKWLLPYSLVDELFILRETTTDAEAQAILMTLQTSELPSRIIIASSERLLDRHYQQLLQADRQHTFLSFDEQHLLMRSERRRVRLIELSTQMLSLFLTATPNQETYQLAGCKPVAIMSSGQKQAAGQGQFPVLIKETARSIADRNQFPHYRFWTRDFWNIVGRKILLGFANAIEPEQSSAAVSIVENLPFYLHRKPYETDVRWRMQVPMAHKILCIIDDNATLVNFSHALQHSRERDLRVYYNGNLVSRCDISNFFQLPPIDDILIQEDYDAKQDRYLEALQPDEYSIGQYVRKISLKEQLKHNIFHHLIEYVLMDLTGLDEITHNHLRKKDMPAFQELIRRKFVQKHTSYYQTKLAAVIDVPGAQRIAKLLQYISEDLGYFRHYQPGYFAKMINNWSLDQSLFTMPLFRRREFQSYAEEHLMIGVMRGMQNSEMAIEDSHPFLGLREEQYPMYEDGVLRDQVKCRQHSTLETLNDESFESKFTPIYQDFNEEICDHYFRLGFVGVYVSNKKTEGFSDRNLHTVINIAEHNLSSTNSPDTLIQGIGRNRGLDDTIIPTYIHALGRQQRSIFDLKHLQSDDYYPALFQAQQMYHQQFIKVLGQQVCMDIIHWFKQHVDKDETINLDKYKKQVLKIIAQSLRRLNDHNHHDIKLSRSQLTKVIHVAMKTLKVEIAALKQPYKLPLFIKILGSLLNFIVGMYYNLKRIRPAIQRIRYSRLHRSTIQAHDRVYLKIIKNTNFKMLIEHIAVAKEFRDWFSRKKLAIETIIRKDAELYLKATQKDELTQHKEEFFIPLLSKFIVDSKQELLLHALRNMPHFLEYLKTNEATLLKLRERPDDPEIPATVLQLLQHIPGLESLTLDDVIHYPAQLATHFALLAQEPIHILMENPTLYEAALTSLAAYLQGPFLQRASAFFLGEDLNLLATMLRQGDQAKNFLRHLFVKIRDHHFPITNIHSLIVELKTFFSCDALESIETRAKECVASLVHEKTLLQENFLEHINDVELTQMASTIHEQLLPCLVNVYPVEIRHAILADASLAKVKELLKTDGQRLMHSMGTNISENAPLVFSRLTTRPLPPALKLEDIAMQAQQTLMPQFAAVLQISKTRLAWTTFTNPATWVEKIQNPQYIYSEPIANIIRSDLFINTISPLFSFYEWQDLRMQIQNNAHGTIALAHALIDVQPNLPQPAELIQLINQSYTTQYRGAEVVAKTAIDSLEEQKKSFAEKGLAALSPAIQERMTGILSQKFAPLLASFIQDQHSREAFLQHIRHDQLGTLVLEHQEKLQKLPTEDFPQANHIALELINTLLLPAQQLRIDQIKHPIGHATEQAQQLHQDVSKTLIRTYLTTEFLVLAQQIFSMNDYTKLAEYLQDDEQCGRIVEKIAALPNITFEHVLTQFQAEESLKEIKPLEQRLSLFSSFLTNLADGDLNHFDTDKLTTVILEQLSPIIFHPEFYTSLNQIMGFLDQDDLMVMLTTLGKTPAEEQATLILEFMSIVKSKDPQMLQEKFMTLSTHSFDDLPLKKVMDLLGVIITEILDCQCDYNQHDKKGQFSCYQHSKLYPKLSPALQDIQIEANEYSFMSHFSRKIFFIQAIRNGLSRCGQVHADSNLKQIQILERIHNHILRPLWWGINMSKLGYAMIKTGRYIAFQLRAFGFRILNGFKFLCNLIYDNYFTISRPNPVSIDYNDTAFELAEKINALTPFDSSKVATIDCPVDTIMDLEQSITTGHLRFFSPAPTPAETIAIDNTATYSPLSP